MKVLHLAESASGGGAESVFRDTILKLLAVDNKNQHLVACVSDGSEPFRVNLDFGQLKSSKISQIFSVNNYRLLKDFLTNHSPDLIHIQNYGNLSPSILKAIFDYKSSANKVRVIHTVHTFEYVCSHHAAFDYKKNRCCTDCASNNFKFKIFYRGCSRLGIVHSWAKGLTSLIANFYIKKGVVDEWLTPSDFLKHYMLKRSLDDENIQVLRNPMNDSFLKQEFGPNIKENRPFEFVYFGRFSEEKNLEILIEGFKLILEEGYNAKLTMVGKGVELSKLIDQCISYGISDNVEFIEFLPSKVLVERLKTAHVSVLTSKCFETASLVINEAVMCGLVPIVSNHGAMKETLEILDVGLSFNCNEVQDLVNQLKKTIQNYNFYYCKLEDSFDIIKKEYNSNHYAEKLIDIYSRN